MAEALRQAVVDQGRRGPHLHASTVNIDCGAGRRGVRVVASVGARVGEGEGEGGWGGDSCSRACRSRWLERGKSESLRLQ